MVRAPVSDFARGDLIHITWPSPDRGVFGFVDEVGVVAEGTQLSGAEGFVYVQTESFSPPAEEATRPRWDLYPLDTQDATGILEGSPPVGTSGHARIQLLRCEIHAWKANVLIHRVENAAFHPSHPRYFGALPSDADLYAPAEGQPAGLQLPERQRFIDQTHTERRFPFCASEQGDSQAGGQPDGRREVVAAGLFQGYRHVFL